MADLTVARQVALHRVTAVRARLAAAVVALQIFVLLLMDWLTAWLLEEEEEEQEATA
jgi:hypothetical protein